MTFQWGQIILGFKVLKRSSKIALFRGVSQIGQIGRFDLDFLSKCRVAQANSVKMDLNQLCDALRMILYLNDFA